MAQQFTMRMKFGILILLFSITSSVWGQKTWTLEECISYAIENNLQLKDSEYVASSSKEGKNQALRNLLPTVQGYADYGLNLGRSTDPFTDAITETEFFSNNYRLSANLDIFRGFQKMNLLKASQFAHRADLNQADQERFLLAFRVMAAYFDMIFYEGLLENAKQQLNISQNNQKLVQKQFDLGLRAAADLYEAESTLLADSLAMTQNKNLWQTSQLVLIQEMNLDENSIDIQPFTPESQKIALSSGATDSIFDQAMVWTPSIKAQQFRVKESKKRFEASKGNLSPSLALNAWFGTGYFETNVDANGETIGFRDQLDNNQAKYVGATLNIPIGLNQSIRSRAKQQKIAYLQAKNQMKSQELELYRTIQQLVQRNEALSHEERQSQKNLEAQQQTFAVQQKKYEKGLISLLELSRAQQLMADARNNQLRVRLQQEINEKTLDFYQGKNLFFLKHSTN